jgi:4-amino-4-deoxy-L-arabinose transferase-like glycosyltransferase
MKMYLPKWPLTKKTQDILFLTLIILLAIGIRVGITINTLGVPIYSGMAIFIGEAARNLAEGRGYVIDSAYIGAISKVQTENNMLVDLQDVPPPDVGVYTPYYELPPGPSLLLAGTYRVFGEYRYIYFRLIEAIISSFGCLLIYLLGKELFNRNVGLVAAFLYAIYLPLAYISTWVLNDALVPFFTLLSLYLFVMGVRKKSITYYILAGFTVGIGCYFSPSIVLLPVIFGLGVLIYAFGQSGFKKNILNVFKITAIMILVPAVVLSPWIVRNYNITGHVMLMRPAFWQGIWEGFGEYKNPVGAVLNDAITYEQVTKELGYNIPYGTPEFDAVLREKSINAIKANPGWWLSVLARRVPHTIVYGTDMGIAYIPRDSQGNIRYDTPSDDSYSRFIIALKSAKILKAWEIIREHPYATFTSGMALLFTFIPVLLSIICICVARREWRAIVLVATVPLYFCVLNIIFFVNWKTLLPGALAYVLFSAIALNYFASKFKKRSSTT